MKRTLSTALLLAGALALFAGCASYRLGSMLPPDVKTVYVPTFVNQTDQPGIEADATQAAIAELQMDGSLDVVPNREEADAILNVALTGYTLTPLTYNENQRTATTEYRLRISATLSLVRRTNREVLSESAGAYGEETFDVIGDLTSSKEAALPGATEDLARRIVAAIVETWQ